MAFFGSSHKNIAKSSQIIGIFSIVSKNFLQSSQNIFATLYIHSEAPEDNISPKFVNFSLDFNIYSLNFFNSSLDNSLFAGGFAISVSISVILSQSIHFSISSGFLNQSTFEIIIC
jgi:hypothetical protein